MRIRCARSYAGRHRPPEIHLLDLSRIGFNEAHKGIYRTSFSEPDMAARRWLMQTLETKGFQTEMDGAGNVYGRLGNTRKPTITLGPHLDTVLACGMFDGALGVVARSKCCAASRNRTSRSTAHRDRAKGGRGQVS